MLKWLSRSRNRSRVTGHSGGNRIRLGIEALEPRYCPAGPSITSFTATVMTGQTVMLMGTVSDTDPGPVTIQFSGVASGSTTASNGGFSFQTQANALGTIYATPSDSQGSGPQSQTMLSTPPPSITLNMAQGCAGSCALSGTVQANSPAGLSVIVNGAIVTSGTTATDGSYSLTAEANRPGTVTVYTEDSWGQESNVVQATVTADGAAITMTVAQQADKGVLVTGQVPGVTAPVTVTLTGVVSGTATTDASGNFSFTGTASALGTISAWATVSGQTSYGSCQLTDSPPSITDFQGTSAENNVWILTGQVNAAYAPGLTVTLSGIPGGTETVIVGGDDTFSYEVQLSAGEDATVEASVTDWWGEVSAPVSVYI